MTTSGESLPRRGEVWWVRVDKLRPAVIVQTDRVHVPRIKTFLVVPMTSRLHLEDLPGNVRLDRKVTGISKTSVANVYDIQKVHRSDLVENVGRLSTDALQAIEEGLRLVLEL